MQEFLLFLISGFFVPVMAWADDIRDVKPPVLLPGHNGMWAVLVLLIFLGGLAWVLRNRLSPRCVTPPLPASPPWETAFQRLRALKDTGLSGGEDVKNFYTELSDILRRYMEGRFQIRAPEMTTEEFLSHLKAAPALNAQHKLSLQEFLACCDMVKFARFSSSLHEMERGWNLVWQLVSDTQPQT